MKQLQKSTTRRRGAAAVEAALVLPLLIAFLFGIVEYSRYLTTMSMLRNAARQGAEYAAIHTSSIFLNGTNYGNATADVTSIVDNVLGGNQALSGRTINLFLSDSTGNNLGNWASAETGKYVCLQIQGDYKFFLSGMLALPASMTLTVQAVRRSEGN